MRLAVVAALLACCAYVTYARLQEWRDDRRLWAAAFWTAPSPRAAVNYAAAELKAGEFERAARLGAWALSHGPDAQVVANVRAQLRWISAFGPTDYCAHPPYAAWCS